MTLFSLLFVHLWSWSTNLSDYPVYSFDVRFTNPVCQTYNYDEPMQTVSGHWITSKPKNVYCTNADSELSRDRAGSPWEKIKAWISDSENKEMYLSAFSFSSTLLKDELCNAIGRGVKVRFALHKESSQKLLDELVNNCGVRYEGQVEAVRLGNEGGIALAHSKMIMINPRSTIKSRIIFSSANFTSGITLNHENWNFVETDPGSYFAKEHLCFFEALLDEGIAKQEFLASLNLCRGKIPFAEEQDAKLYVIPGDGDEALTAIEEEFDKSTSSHLAVHRFSNKRVVNKLISRLQEGSFSASLVGDDDLYWIDMGVRGRFMKNDINEVNILKNLIGLGLKVRYMETNPFAHLLHHNKFILFNTDGDARAVFTGAGNITGAGFKRNYENFYMIKIPEVVKAYSTQFSHLFETLATPYKDMPIELKHATAAGE